MIRIEPFQEHQAEEVSELILRNIREINSKDYPVTFIQLLTINFSPARILEKAKRQFIYVALKGNKIIGTVALENQSTPKNQDYYVVAMFVLPEYHGTGIGKKLINVVEAKAIEIGAEKVRLRASVSTPGFYLKMGYHFVDDGEKTDEWGNIMMEKRFEFS